MEAIRVYYYSGQRLGNYQIRVGKKKDMNDFRFYVETILKKKNSNVFESTKYPGRRFYVDEAHIEIMKRDAFIDLKEAFIWKENK